MFLKYIDNLSYIYYYTTILHNKFPFMSKLKTGIVAASALAFSVTGALADDKNLEHESLYGFTLETDKIRNETTAYINSILAKVNTKEIEIKPAKVQISEDLDIELHNKTSWHYTFKNESDFGLFNEYREELWDENLDIVYDLVMHDLDIDLYFEYLEWLGWKMPYLAVELLKARKEYIELEVLASEILDENPMYLKEYSHFDKAFWRQNKRYADAIRSWDKLLSNLFAWKDYFWYKSLSNDTPLLAKYIAEHLEKLVEKNPSIANALKTIKSGYDASEHEKIVEMNNIVLKTKG